MSLINARGYNALTSWTALSVISGFLLAAGPLLTAARGEIGPSLTFTTDQCDLRNVPQDLVARVRCGTVAVPRDYGHPDRGSFSLAVVIVASVKQPAQPDPDLYISGGPGGPLTVYTAAQAKRPLAPDRDLILIDQRGTGSSEPTLCPSLDRDLVAAVAIDDVGRERRPKVFAACRAQALAQGVNLADFGTTVTVEDLETVRRALGIARWNVFGVSYGTTVAMTLMASYPETVRAAVLDSVYPPDPILPPWSRNVADAREAFFAACEADEVCRGSFPDLAGTYRSTVARLADEPLMISVPVDMQRPKDRIRLTPPLFAFVVGRLVYYPTFYPGLPRLIAAVSGGETSLFADALASLFLTDSDPRTGSRLSLRAAVDCRDRPRYHGDAPDIGDGTDMTTLEGVCDAWAPLGPPPLVPQDTTVPTLVLAGEFDPNARPTYSRHVAEMMGRNVQWVEFMGMGHSVRAFSPCAAGLVSSFIDRPDQPLNVSCAAQAPAVRYLPNQQAR